jgi:hypothetical protein
VTESVEPAEPLGCDFEPFRVRGMAGDEMFEHAVGRSSRQQFPIHILNSRELFITQLCIIDVGFSNRLA